ncbi:ATPase [Methanobacterium alcaliphilum]|uniref:ATPase n=1 Tax=Methanobacterium alcaliphilum TaxID=392018 RepID=UPI00200B7FFD|nr:ATPase [Methanobacterium alcaliphilum]MCK9151769.1 ATPase [Methanobacterium alcaliphilum]
MEITRDILINKIEKIRADIAHDSSEVNIKEFILNPNKKELLIITPDRPDKSAVIGKGGWVVGRLKESLNLNKVHVDAYSDLIVKKYRMELALEKIDKIISDDLISDLEPLLNLKDLLLAKKEYLSLFDFSEYFDFEKFSKNETKKDDFKAVVALSGGVDSSFSLIIAHQLGFNPIAVTADPGTIVLPGHFKNNINNLCSILGVKHEYLNLDFSEFIGESFKGRFHPCGRCSKMIHESLMKYAQDNNIKIIIFGDLLSTGSQSLNYKDEILRINLPAFLGVSKQELKKITEKYNIQKSNYFGCPLLGEVQKKFPHMRRYSIQRVLRETRSGVLEPGEALDLIWSLCKNL